MYLLRRRGRRAAAALSSVLAVCQAAAMLLAARPAGADPAAASPLARTEAAARMATTAAPSPCPHVRGQPAGASPRIMVVGDSISQGSSGDFTWRYRLDKHLMADGLHPRFVGPYNWLFNNVTGVQGDCTYADPRFSNGHDAVWGRMLADEVKTIGSEVKAAKPDYVLMLLGINDLFFKGDSTATMTANLTRFIANARAARPGVRIVAGLLLPDVFQQISPAFAAEVSSYNNAISGTAARLSTRSAPIAVAHDGANINVAADLWDGRHPNANGEIKIAAGFADVLAARFHLGSAYPRPFPVLPTGPRVAPKLSAVPGTSSGTAVLSWTLSPGATGYFVYIRDITSGQATFARLPDELAPSNDPWTGGLLTPGDIYLFKLQACKGSDCLAFSNVAGATPHKAETAGWARKAL